MTHQKTNTKIWVLLTVFAVFFCSIAISFPTKAADYILTQELTDPNAPVDVCPNIPGTQATIPNGMQLDGGGNCYTPTPVTPPVTPVTPVTVDLCNNLPGTQTTLPTGYYRTSNGNCYKQPSAPAQPVDVCSNLEEIQTGVPEGYYLDTSNNCVVIPEPTDECPNITGPQSTIPDGMVRENNICYTPTTTTPTDNGTTKTPTQTESPSYENVPGFLRPAIKSIVSLIPESTQEWLRSLPAATAKAVPYYIFLMVVILAIIPILQSIREALFVRQIRLILLRERGIAEEKDNFVTLASHYLRTPLTLMSGGLDIILAQQELAAEQLAPLKLKLASLDARIGTILQDVEANSALRGINTPPQALSPKSVWRSGWFWGPIVASILLTIVANFLLVIVGEKEIGITHTFFHFLVAAIAFIILYLGVRNLHLQRKLRAENQLLIDHEKAIDEARNTFISQTTLTLREALEEINQERAILGNAPSASYFEEGYARIESLLQKFLLLSQVEAGVDRNMEVIDVHEAIDNLIVSYNTAISAKKLTVTNSTSPTFIHQNRLLFNFVLSSVIDNAIKFNQDGGTIEVSAEPNNKMLIIKVSDNGIGINSEKLDQLFKPFSRTTSAIEFNYEGLGFSLFLDKIIMDYTDGDIAIQSTENEGTQLSVATLVSMKQS